MDKAIRKVNKVSGVFLVFMTIILTLSLAACQSKEPVTADIFKEKAEGLGYTVIDITDQYADSPHILKILGCEDGSVYVEFLELVSKDSAVAVFNGDKIETEAYKGNGSSESSVSTDSYQKYTLKTSEKYYLLERVGATLICAYSDKSESEKLDNIIKELGY